MNSPGRSEMLAASRAAASGAALVAPLQVAVGRRRHAVGQVGDARPADAAPLHAELGPGLATPAVDRQADQGQEQQRQEDGGGADDEGDLLRLQPGAVRRVGGRAGARRGGGRRRRRGRKVDVGRGFQRSVRGRDPHGQRHGAVTRRLVGDAVLVGEAGGRTAVEAGQGGGVGDRRHAAAAGRGQLAEHGAVALAGDELDHVASARRRPPPGRAWRCSPCRPPSDSRTIARSRGVGGELAGGEDDRVVQRGLARPPSAGRPATLSGPGRWSGAATSEGCDPKATTPTLTSGGSTVRNSVGRGPGGLDRRARPCSRTCRPRA